MSIDKLKSELIDKSWLIGILVWIIGLLFGSGIGLGTYALNQRFETQNDLWELKYIRFEEDLKGVQSDLKTIISNTSSTQGDLKYLTLRIASLEQALGKIYTDFRVNRKESLP